MHPGGNPSVSVPDRTENTANDGALLTAASLTFHLVGDGTQALSYLNKMSTSGNGPPPSGSTESQAQILRGWIDLIATATERSRESGSNSPQRRRVGSRTFFERCLQADPTDMGALMGLAKYHETMGSFLDGAEVSVDRRGRL